MKWMGNFKDLTGMKFNMLTVLEQAGKERGMTYYKLLTPEFRAHINWQTGGTGGKMKEMTPEEAIEVLDNEYKRIELQIMSLKGTIKENTESFRYRIYVKENLKTAITALKEIQQYRAIGTAEECRTAMDYWKYLRERRCGLDAVVEKCMEYEKIGTVEECRKAVDKQKPKKIIIRDWNPTKCPTCGHELSTSLGDGYYKHPTFLERCPKCGQTIQWENEDD